MVYYFKYKEETIGWKTNGLYDPASERVQEKLRQLSIGREDNGVRCGVCETDPTPYGAKITKWVTPDFAATDKAETFEALLACLR